MAEFVDAPRVDSLKDYNQFRGFYTAPAANKNAGQELRTQLTQLKKTVKNGQVLKRIDKTLSTLAERDDRYFKNQTKEDYLKSQLQYRKDFTGRLTQFNVSQLGGGLANNDTLQDAANALQQDLFMTSKGVIAAKAGQLGFYLGNKTIREGLQLKTLRKQTDLASYQKVQAYDLLRAYNRYVRAYNTFVKSNSLGATEVADRRKLQGVHSVIEKQLKINSVGAERYPQLMFQAMAQNVVRRVHEVTGTDYSANLQNLLQAQSGGQVQLRPVRTLIISKNPPQGGQQEEFKMETENLAKLAKTKIQKQLIELYTQGRSIVINKNKGSKLKDIQKDIEEKILQSSDEDLILWKERIEFSVSQGNIWTNADKMGYYLVSEELEKKK